MKSRTRQHQPIEQHDSHACVDSFLQGAQHAARLRSVNQKFVSGAGISGGNHKRLTIDRETDVTDKSFVKNLINYFAFVAAAFWQTLQSCALSLGKLLHRVLVSCEVSTGSGSDR